MLFYIGQFLISALCHGLGYVSLGISYFYKWPSFQNTGRKVHHLAGVYGSSFPIILALQDMAVEGVCSLYIHRVFLRVCTAPSDNAGRCTNRVPQYAFPVFRNIPESDFFRHHPVIRLPQFLLVCKNQDILMALEERDVTVEQGSALLDSPSPLADIYREWQKLETRYMEDVRDTIESCANHKVQVYTISHP